MRFIRCDAELQNCIYFSKFVEVWQQGYLQDAGYIELYSKETIRVNGEYYSRSNSILVKTGEADTDTREYPALSQKSKTYVWKEWELFWRILYDGSSKVLRRFLDMIQVTEKKSLQLSDAYKDMLQVVKGVAGNELKEKQYSVQAEITYINPRVYGSNQYVKAYGDDDSEIQLIVPSEIAKQLSVKNVYDLQGNFEVSSNPSFGMFQFRITEATLLGQSRKIEAKKQAANEIIEKGYLDKYKNDFTQFRGRRECKVALVTSPQSQVINDVFEVFKSRKGIQHEIIPVKLYDAAIISEGITYASGGNYDVIMVIRGGGSESDFAVFNDPCISKAIHDSKIPVIVGIGHTDNNTFADKAADRSETTPTKAARFLVDMLGRSEEMGTVNNKNYQFNKPYRTDRSHWKAKRQGKLNLKMALVYLGLMILLLAAGATVIFTVLPKVFERILNNM
jgi:exodeoxyribonuclease VII large subunit